MRTHKLTLRLLIKKYCTCTKLYINQERPHNYLSANKHNHGRIYQSKLSVIIVHQYGLQLTVSIS